MLATSPLAYCGTQDVIRVALYARYSSELQNPRSVDDQLQLLGEYAARERARDNWKIVGTYHDSAISGSSIIRRPGIQALMEEAKRGKFDIVASEAMDRISRDQGEISYIYKVCRFAYLIRRLYHQASYRNEGDDE